MISSPHSAPDGTVRLAQSDTVTVDLCPCGTLHLHMGALSLHLKPDEAASMLQTLGLAFARRQALLARATDSGELVVMPWPRHPRTKGEA